MPALRSIVLALGLLCASLAPAVAQAPVAAPPGMTQEQFNALVDAISNSVTEKLKAEGVPAAAAPTATPAPAAAPAPASKSSKAPPPPKIIKVPVKEGPDEFAIFFQRAGKVVLAVPVLGRHLAAIPSLLDQRA